ncbi:MAG: hypothetical protein K9G80_08570 [Candidatus Nanopelagicales bacterium]|nr:hypothetical protein [Candidatus Nanopelagicales bacterium]MCF8557615.1 hypothetical protein [Candidatus Nanopelagicales bacterium]
MQDDSTWACPEGFSSEDDPVTSESTCSKPVSPSKTYYCPEGYVEGPDFPADDSCVMYKEVPAYEYQDAVVTGYECGSHKTYFASPTPGCYQLTWRDNKWEWQLTGVQPKPKYSCPEGWTLDDDMCKRQNGTELVVDKDRDPKSMWSCPETQLEVVRYDDDDDEGPLTCPDETAPPVETTHWFCPEGYSTSDEPVTSESTCIRQTTEEVAATCPVAGDVLTNIGDEEVANWQCITPATPATPIGGGGAAVFTASAASSGGVELCLVDGVTTTSITYDVTESATGPTPTDAQYAANVAAVDAVNASIAAQTPEGATLGACGAPIAEVPVVVSPVLPATVPEEPESVAVPQAATVPAAVPAGGGSEAPAMPTWALALALIAAIGGTAAASRLVTAGK